MGNFADLFDPKPDYNYFALADAHPFEVDSEGFSLANAGWLADCALLAYLREAADVLERLQFGNLQGACFGFDRPGAQGFVAHAAEFAVVSFRGTEVGEWEDVVADARIRLVSTTPENGRVHEGFLDALDSIWLEVEGELGRIQQSREQDVPVWFTGHSLGAAMATLAADRYDGARALYTYGSPRVGDKAFRGGITVNAYRIVNNNDGVTSVPPGAPLSAYRHVGDLKYLDADGGLSDDPQLWASFKASLTGHLRAIQDGVGDFRRGDFDEVNIDQLRDHAPIDYATGIWRTLAI